MNGIGWLGILFALGLAGVAYAIRALNLSGFLAAWALGAVILALGGWRWAALLLTFFFTSSLLSKLHGKRNVDNEKFYAKGSRRDAFQVLANGGMAGLLMLAAWLFHRAGSTSAVSAIWAAYAASLASASADTWATELGTFSKKEPVLITNGKPVPPGTSGGITLLGTLAAATGALLIGILTWLLRGELSLTPSIILIITLAGLAGALVDSLLGATVQAQFYCPACQKQTEKHPTHICGTQTILTSGQPWFNNDLVNFLSITIASSIAALFFNIFT